MRSALRSCPAASSNLGPVRVAVQRRKGDLSRSGIGNSDAPRGAERAAPGAVHLALPPTVTDTEGIVRRGGPLRVASPAGTCIRGGSSVPTPIRTAGNGVTEQEPHQAVAEVVPEFSEL